MSDSTSDASGSDEEVPEYEVERILAESIQDAQVIYLVKWLNYPDNQCTWEPAESFLTPATLADWERQRANHDTLDEEEVARVQARMDAFQGTQEFDRILAEASKDGHPIYLVKWVDFEDEHCTWEPAESFLTPEALADWEHHLANHDTLDEEAIALVQARMDAFRKAEKEKRPTRELRLRKRSPENRPRELSSSSTQPIGKDARHSATAPPDQSYSHEVTKSKNGIAHTVRPGQGHAVTPPPLKPSQPMPEKSRIPSKVSGSHSAARTSEIGERASQKAVAVHSSGKTLQPKSDKASNKVRGTPASRPQLTEHKAGQRFNSLSHQNNYMKKARQEPAPDMSKIDLMSPEEFGQPGIRRNHNHRDFRYSSLFVPEDENALQPSVESSFPKTGTLSDPEGKSFDSRLSPIIPDQSNTTVISASDISAPDSRAEDIPNGSSTYARPTASDRQQQSGHKPDVTSGLPNTKSLAPTEPRTTDKRQSIESPVSQVSLVSVPLEQPSLRRSVAVGNDSSKPKSATAPEQISTNIDSRTASRSSVPPRTHLAVDRPSTDNYSPQQPSAIPARMGDRVLIANNGRSYRKGEIIVNLRFGDYSVGDVRFVSLPRWTSNKILHLKEPRSPLQLHFEQRFTMDMSQFSDFSQNIQSRRHGVGAVEPYEDTLQATESLSQHLEAYNLGAIWEYPEPGDTLILVLYSSRAPGWQHLEQMPLPISTSCLHLAVLNKVPGFFLENDPTRTIHPVAYKQSAEPARPRTDGSQPHLQLSISADTTDQVPSPTELTTSVTAKSPLQEPMPVVPTPKSPGPPGRRDSMSFGDPMDWSPSSPAAGSQIPFAANFDDMVNGLDRAKKGPRIFISFAKSHPSEAKAVKEWLSQKVHPRSIYSDDESDDWDDFREETSSNKSGVVLFHEDFPCYSDLPSLSRSLKSSSLFCYSLSFRQQKHGKKDQDNIYTRLFPRGSVLCITEDTLISHSEAALSAVVGFEKSSFGKEHYWKLILPPDLASWVLLRANASEDETGRRYMKILEALQRLRMRWSEVSASTGQEHDDPERFIKDMTAIDDDQLVTSPSGLQGYGDRDTAGMRPDAIEKRDQQLLRYFAGWSAINARKYRLFTVVDTNHTAKTENHAGHIYFKEPALLTQDGKRKLSETKR